MDVLVRAVVPLCGCGSARTACCVEATAHAASQRVGHAVPVGAPHPYPTGVSAPLRAPCGVQVAEAKVIKYPVEEDNPMQKGIFAQKVKMWQVRHGLRG